MHKSAEFSVCVCVCVFYVSVRTGPKRSEVGVSCLQLWIFCASGRLDICSTSKCFLGSQLGRPGGDPGSARGSGARVAEQRAYSEMHTVCACVGVWGCFFMCVLRDLAAVVTAPRISQKARGPREQLWFQAFPSYYTTNKNLHGRNI